MAKFYGVIGFGTTQERSDGVCIDTISERRPYYGDIIRNNKRIESSGNLNDDVNIANDISIVADAFAYQHCFSMRYVEYMGTKWKVKDVEIRRPRLILSIGGVYNDQ